MNNIYNDYIEKLEMIFNTTVKNDKKPNYLQYAGYPGVKIGEQIWMTKNLDVESFRNGDPIPHIASWKEWKKYGVQGKPAWCYYDNREANGEKYGKLYNWHAVSDSRGLAPKGWKVPSDSDWNELFIYLGGDEKFGIKMKAKHGWVDNGTDEVGFSGLPGGFRCFGGDFHVIGYDVYWWSSPENNTNYAWYRQLENHGDDGFYFGNEFKGRGFSVRCLRD